jgi:MYXO-CTERM domain-containing protein
MVTLSGSNFTSNLSVGFGGVFVPGVFQSASTLTAVTPAHAAGPVNVVVRATDNSLSNTLTGGFTYATPDAGQPDAGPPDAGPPDAGPPDAGPPDAGPPDAGPPDAGRPDAGSSDAGPPDAGPSDAGQQDGGGADAGGVDGGASDGGVPDGSVDLLGCSCAAGGVGPTALAFAALVTLAARTRQRRRPTSAPPSQ